MEFPAVHSLAQVTGTVAVAPLFAGQYDLGLGQWRRLADEGPDAFVSDADVLAAALTDAERFPRPVVLIVRSFGAAFAQTLMTRHSEFFDAVILSAPVVDAPKLASPPDRREQFPEGWRFQELAWGRLPNDTNGIEQYYNSINPCTWAKPMFAIVATRDIGRPWSEVNTCQIPTHLSPGNHQMAGGSEDERRLWAQAIITALGQPLPPELATDNPPRLARPTPLAPQ
jgi:pimeloyl-ACP methyl ester carboxylesterase